MKKNYLIFLVALMVANILTIVFYMPKTINAIEQKNYLIEGDSISESGTIKEVMLNEDGYWIETEENSYMLLVYSNIARDNALLDDMQAGDELFFEFAEKELQDIEGERAYVIVRSLSNGEMKIFTFSEYKKSIEDSFSLTILIGLFFTIGSGIIFILCIIMILTNYRSKKRKKA